VRTAVKVKFLCLPTHIAKINCRHMLQLKFGGKKMIFGNPSHVAGAVRIPDREREQFIV